MKVGELEDSAQYASLGDPFIQTFYTSLNYAQNVLHFAVSTTVSVRGELRIFPGLVIPYLGLTCIILPPILVALCGQYHYCPKIRRRERIERVKKWTGDLYQIEDDLWHSHRVDVKLIPDRGVLEDQKIYRQKTKIN